jgi:hypothetical protein
VQIKFRCGLHSRIYSICVYIGINAYFIRMYLKVLLHPLLLLKMKLLLQGKELSAIDRP